MDVKFSARDLEVGIKRLNRLVEYLGQVNPDRFDLSSWGTHSEIYMSEENGSQELKSSRQLVKEIREGSCGTTACACGHAAMIPEFRKAGFRMEFEVDPWADDADADIVFRPPKSMIQYIGMDAAQMFFKLNSDDAENLFMPYSYQVDKPGISDVTTRIKSQVKKMEKKVNRLKKE